MEEFAYDHSTEKLCYPKDPQNKRVSLSKVFDMVAGTSTGSLLATCVVIPAEDDKTKNRYYAEDAINIYTTRGGEVFKKYTLSYTKYGLGMFGFAVVGGLLGFLIGIKMYSNSAHEETMKEFKDLIKARKSIVKNKSTA